MFKLDLRCPRNEGGVRRCSAGSIDPEYSKGERNPFDKVANLHGYDVSALSDDKEIIANAVGAL